MTSGAASWPAPASAAAGAMPDPVALYRALLDSHPEPTFSLAVDGTLVACNRAFARFVGRPADALLGQRLAALVLGPQREAAERACTLVAEGVPQAWTTEFAGPAGTVSIGHVTLAPAVVAGVVAAAQGVARDVTVYRVIEEQLRSRVLTDPLTGLASRTRFAEATARAFRRAERPGLVAVVLLDVDDFKLVNDALGHEAGDALLGVLADRLRAATRGHDVIARLGADQFAVLLDRLAEPGDALVVVERIGAALRAPVQVSEWRVPITASVGVAHWDGTATPSELLRNADLAMCRAKAFGTGQHVVFDAHMQAAARERLALAGDLREAIRAGAIEAAFQPIVSLHDGRVCKAEALARWTHPTRGPVSPGVFIPLAEEMGLVDELGAHMLRLGCRQLRAWRDAAGAADGAAPVGVTVNVSGRQIERGTLVPAVRAALAESGAEPAGLTLELTESVAMRDPERLLAMLVELAHLGVTIAIDDFGTGYSSLSYLHRFPVDVLKIDKSFVDGLAADAAGDAAGGRGHAEVMVRTIVSVAASLGLQTVAEGVETAEQGEALRALGCHMAQGYHFGRPGPAAALLAPRAGGGR